MSLDLILGGSCALLPVLVSALSGTDIKDVVISPSNNKRWHFSSVFGPVIINLQVIHILKSQSRFSVRLFLKTGNIFLICIFLL